MGKPITVSPTGIMIIMRLRRGLAVDRLLQVFHRSWLIFHSGDSRRGSRLRRRLRFPHPNLSPQLSSPPPRLYQEYPRTPQVLFQTSRTSPSPYLIQSADLVFDESFVGNAQGFGNPPDFFRFSMNHLSIRDGNFKKAFHQMDTVVVRRNTI